MRIKTAGFVFEINNLYPYCEQFMSQYLTDEVPEYTITIQRELLEKRKQGLSETYPLYYIEFIEIYRKICDYVTMHGGILMHGAVIEFEGAAYMFTAPSGTGKTTHINLWKKLYGDKVRIINGDKPLIREENGEFIAYGTPWSGKEHLNINASAPLKGIVLLSRSETNSIERINTDKLNIQLIKQVYMPKSSPGVMNALDFADKLFSTVPLYHLKCNISLDAAELACEKITGAI